MRADLQGSANGKKAYQIVLEEEVGMKRGGLFVAMRS
jgi:hypothetical protein